jgi:hypothetical protein
MEPDDIEHAKRRHFEIHMEVAPDITEMFSRPELTRDFLDPAVLVTEEEDHFDIEILEKLRLISALSNAPSLHKNPRFADQRLLEASNPRFPITAVVATDMGSAVYLISDPRDGAERHKNLDKYPTD